MKMKDNPDKIRFACRTFPIEQILKCSFNLNNTEMTLLKHLVSEEDEKDVNELAKKFNKDRSTIQRSLNVLVSKKLINKRQINLESGGYIYVYSSKPKEYIKEKIREVFSNFIDVVAQQVDRW